MEVETPFVKFEIYIPAENLEELAEALYGAGVGKIGAYDHCLSITEVAGRWRPLENARPYLGESGQVFSGREIKVEANCARENAQAALQAIRRVHPYEEPVINILPMINHLFS